MEIGLIKVTKGEDLDLSESLVHEHDEIDYPTKKIRTSGVAVFNKNMEVLTLITSWLNYLVKSKSYSFETARLYGCNLRYLVEYLTSKKEEYIYSERDTCLLTVHATTIQQYYDYLRQDTDETGNKKTIVSSRTIKNRDACYAHFFSNFLYNAPAGYKCLRDDDPYENGSLAGGNKTSIIVPAKFEDVEALIRVAKHEREKCLIQFMYDSGIRRAEVSTITQEQILAASRAERRSIIIDENTYKLPSPYIIFNISGNKGRNREVKLRRTIISKETINRVQKYNSSLEFRLHKRKFIKDQVPAFLNTNGEPYNPSSVSKLITRLSKRAMRRGLIDSPLSPHKLRHGFVTMVLNSKDMGENSVDRLLVAQHCLGHSSLTTTEEYTKIPVEVWTRFVDSTGRSLTRSELMKKLKDRTKNRMSPKI